MYSCLIPLLISCISLGQKVLLNERGRGGTEGWMSVRREGGRERGMKGGRLVIISKGHSVNDYPLG